eukprot:7380195-Prymnesium_polylepis.1
MRPIAPGSSRMSSGVLPDALLTAFVQSTRADTTTFEDERDAAELEHQHWERYVSIFRAGLGRNPVCYDLCCGGGGASRGACQAGAIVHGFDNKPKPRGYGRVNLGVDQRTGQAIYR